MTDHLGGANDQIDDHVDLTLRGAAVELDHHLGDLNPGPFRPNPRRTPVVVGLIFVLLAGGAAVFVAGTDADTRSTESIEAATDADTSILTTDELSTTDGLSTTDDVSTSGDEALGEITVGLTGTDPQPRQPLELVAMDTWTNDPTFGTPIRRLTDMPEGDSAVPLAVAASAWNADETRLLLYQSGDDPSSHRLLELTTDGGVISNRELNIAPADIEQVFWSRTDPDVLRYPTANTLVALNVVTGVEDVLHRFEDCDRIDTGRAPVAPSADERFWGLLCHSADPTDSADRVEAVLLDLESGTERRADVPTGTDLAPIANRDGSRFVLESDTGMTLLDSNLDRVAELPGLDDGNLVIVDGPDGSEWAVGVVFNQELPGTAVRVDLLDPAAGPTVIVGEETGYPYPPGGGTYLAGSGQRRPGLVLIAVPGDAVDSLSTDEAVSTVLDGEILIIDTISSQEGAGEPVVRRLTHHRSSGDSYSTEPHASLSPSGRYAVFASDWTGGSLNNGSSNRAATNTFLLDLTGQATD